MYKSKEIRWFKDSSDRAIIDWVVSKGQAFETTQPRTDFYLQLGKDDVTIKFREGNIEIKHRIGDVENGKLTPNAEGVFENWIKWSFNADKTDKLSQTIVSSNAYDWIETIKTRIGVKVTADTNGDLQILPIKSFVDYGCQIEYTQLKMNSKTVYTFALECFGEKEMKLPEELIQEILSNTQLDLKDSMGYGEFIKK